MKFKVGDPVRHEEFGDGTVIECEGDGHCAVRFDTYNTMLHDCIELCEQGHGWFCEEVSLTAIELPITPIDRPINRPITVEDPKIATSDNPE